MMKNHLWVIATIVIFVFLSCSREIDRSMVIGTYVANHGKGIDTLVIRADGTYRYYFENKKGEKFTNSNKWEFEYFDGKPMITFWEFISIVNKEKHAQMEDILKKEGIKRTSNGKGFWPVEPEMSIFGKIKLCIDPDLYDYYVKIEE